MAVIIKDRVRETTTTTGTGNLTLAGAALGYLAFSAVCSTNDTFRATIQAVDANGVPSGDWETGNYTYSGANTVTRTTVEASSNAGSLVNFAAGTKQIWLDVSATQLGHLADTTLANTFTADLTISTASAIANLNINSTGGTGNNWTIRSHSDGRLLIFDSTASAARVEIAPTTGAIEFHTAATFDSTVVVTTSIATGTGTTTTAGLKLLNGTAGAFSGYGAIYPENASPSTTNWAFLSKFDGSATGINATGHVFLQISNAVVADVTSTGIAVTGTQSISGVLTATGGIYLPQAQPVMRFYSNNATDWVDLQAINQVYAGLLINNFTTQNANGVNAVFPNTDNVTSSGTSGKRWSTVYSATGTINTSDAREKTPVRTLADAEIQTAKQLSKEIGAYQWLSAVKQKGGAAREHIGMTVQRAIEIFKANGLDPFNYGCICYDKWDRVTVEHPEISAKDAALDGELTISPAVKAEAAWTETIQEAGDRYSFRMDELLMFIAYGASERLAALEYYPHHKEK